MNNSRSLLIHFHPLKSNYVINSIKSAQTKSHGPKSDLF